MSIPTPPLPPPKPISELWRPDLVRLPELTPGRRRLRRFLHGLARLILFLCLKVEIRGLENFPRFGAALVVTNHLGDADTPLLLSTLPVAMEAMGKIELHQFPVLGKIMEAYGVIWLHRGLPDRRALRAALQAFSEGRMVIIAPEGRYSLLQGLEEGTEGAAFLARNGEVPIVPVALTGTGNSQVYSHLRRFRRAPVTLTVGVPFRLPEENAASAGKARSLKADTRLIMENLARLLPPEYRGVYADSPEI